MVDHREQRDAYTASRLLCALAHIDLLDLEAVRTLSKQFAVTFLFPAAPFTPQLSNGDEVAPEDAENVVRKMKEVETYLSWDSGSFMVINNHEVMHGRQRNPYLTLFTS